MTKEPEKSMLALPDLNKLTHQEQHTAIARAIECLHGWAAPYLTEQKPPVDPVAPEIPAVVAARIETAAAAAIAAFQNRLREEVETLRSEILNSPRADAAVAAMETAGDDAFDQLQSALEAALARIDQALDDNLRALASQARENLSLLHEKFNELALRLEANGGDNLLRLEQKQQNAIGDLEGLADQLAVDLRLKGEEAHGEITNHWRRLLQELQDIKAENLQALEDKRAAGEDRLDGIIETGVSRLSSFAAMPKTARMIREANADFLTEQDDE